MTKVEIKKIETVYNIGGKLVTVFDGAYDQTLDATCPVATEWGVWVNGNLYSRHDTEAEATAEREYHASDNYYLSV